MFKKISRLIFWFSIAFILISLWTITIAQQIHYEFQNAAFRSSFYHAIFNWFPVAILLTLFGTIKRNHDIIRKILTVIMTVTFAVSAFIFLINTMFTIGFGVWRTERIIYESRHLQGEEIRLQLYDIGALGYGKRRVAKVTPFTSFFYQITEIDTNNINKSDWNRVDKEGDIKFP